MAEKLWLLIPELILFGGVVILAVMGLSPKKNLRDLLPFITAGCLVAAGVATPIVYGSERGGTPNLMLPALAPYVKVLVCAIGVLLTMLGAGQVDRRLEADVASGRLRFDPIRATRGEYYVFFLLSLIGVMLCSSANDLIWLFLALELTSLPTYIMIAMSRPARRAQEAAMKYFFLGAMSASIFLYGFSLLYGATGTIVLTEMRDVLLEAKAETGSIGLMATFGLILTILGVAYKIAAAPMHFYAADVYEGAAASVTAFLGFVPKAAGAIALMLLLSVVGWGRGAGDTLSGLPEPVLTTLWMMSVLTMTLGNIGALLQRSPKRMLAYSSIAHSGYLIIGLIAGPGHGLNAVLFYLLVYGIMNTGAFAVIASLERQGEEIDSIEDFAGLHERQPTLAWAPALTTGSLLGFPPLLGFIGKLYLFIAGVQAGQIALVVIAAVNSAVSAWYYLRLAGIPILARSSPRSETVERVASPWPRIAAVLAALAVVILPIFAQRLLDMTDGVTGETTNVVEGDVPAPELASGRETD